MIKNQWYVVLESREVKAGKPVGVTRMGEKMVFWRETSGKVVCMADRCPHLGAALCMGRLHQDHLVCPFHGFEYDASGACRVLPALGKNGNIPKAMRATVYPTYEAHHFIWIWWGDTPAPEQPPRFFDIDESFSYTGFNELWGVHYSRMVENQLDVQHLPFVHTDTIGRGGRTVVDGPIVRLEDGMLKLWVFNRQDDGTPPRKAEELPAPQRPPFLMFIFPNLWQNRISEDLRVLAAFVPVDEEHGRIYLRFYQRFLRVPILREIVNWIGNIGNKHILHQDRRVVLGQTPRKTQLKKMGEKLVPGDRAILAYRTHRHELQKAAGQISEEE